MTPKLRTHCATTLAALVLTLPVATYAYADGPLTHSAESRGDGEGRGRGGEDGRYDGSGRYGGEERGERGPYGGDGRDGSRRYGQSTHGEERGRSRTPGAGADHTGPDRRTLAAGDPAHGAPSHRRADGGAAPEQGTGTAGDRPPADPGRSRAAHAPRGKAAERPDPSPTPSLAGRQAGEGRLRPGRTSAPSPDASTPPGRHHDDGLGHGRDPEEAATEEDTTPHDENTAEAEAHAVPDSPSPSEPTPTDDASPAAAGRSHPRPVPQPLERQIPALTLGAGCALMGLGLGYMGLRLRRG
ncbi:hypothetical protein [Streptomyces marianii]|uniref:Uncharacterized protein n=1 Tax=Streptomyces marianii TaxID=1817406 RepID=A0A5R9E7K4_9ACTN|nr:hypothetical protein [Streptomyces marianii]TLQ44792.1 hypothetical protein FEF34_18375 [Streptomyces marianii]